VGERYGKEQRRAAAGKAYSDKGIDDELVELLSLLNVVRRVEGTDAVLLDHRYHQPIR
jgi:hypothetical protein